MDILGLNLRVTLSVIPTETAKQRGTQAYTRMQTIFRKGIMEQLEGGMFEKAGDSMRKHLQALKVSCAPSRSFGTSLQPWAVFGGREQHPRNGSGEHVCGNVKASPYEMLASGGSRVHWEVTAAVAFAARATSSRAQKHS